VRPRPRPRAEGWFRPLNDDRLEIFLKSPLHGIKIRCSGKAVDLHELVDWFEEKTGLAVNVPNRVRRGPKPMQGQLDLLEPPAISEPQPPLGVN
jgi:hypothetical protein